MKTELFTTVLLAVFIACQSARVDDTERLRTAVFKDYSDDVLPENASVEIAINLQCAIYDEKTRVLTSRIWQFMSWQDSRLAWNPADYGGISTLHTWRAWSPDIRLYNSIGRTEIDWTQSVVTSTGQVVFVPPMTVKTVCRPGANTIDCKMSFGSWTYDGHELDIKLANKGFSTDHYDDACPYKVSTSTVERKSVKYDCCPEPYIEVEVNFSLVPN